MELHLGGLTIKIERSHFWLAMCQKKWKNADRKEHKGRKARRKCREAYTVNCISRLVTRKMLGHCLWSPFRLHCRRSCTASFRRRRPRRNTRKWKRNPRGLVQRHRCQQLPWQPAFDDNTTRNESSMRAVSGLAIIPSWNLSASFLTHSLYRCSNLRMSISLCDSKYFHFIRPQ